MFHLRNTCYTLSIAALLSLCSCNETTEDTAVTSDSSLTAQPADTSKSVWNGAAPANAQAIPQAQPAPATPVVAGVNPAHGQPNHRCDIAVGAPLNSPRQQVAQPAAPVSTLPATGNPGATSVRLNPAHGQPGHDCAVPVGQPLKSA